MTIAAESNTAEGHIRLHISPLRPDLLQTYLGPSLTPLARNISYHTVQTIPEKGFGYVELPTMEATKLKKKLNGSILKGQKIRIDDAKPEKRKRAPDDDEDVGESEAKSKKTRRSKKSKVQDKIIQGYALEDGRKVKRGWTETPAEKRQDREAKKKSKDKGIKSEKKDKKDKKRKREASKYTNEPECLFRIDIPAAVESGSADATGKKSKKDKKKQDNNRVVHEFSNTKKHASFLKSASAVSDGKRTQEYVDGKGWVDAEGNVLEEETENQRERRERKERKERKRAEKAAAIAEIESREQQAEAVKEPLNSDAALGEDVLAEDAASDSNESASSSDTSSAEDDSSEEDSDSSVEREEAKEVHPLEALYKRPKLSSLNTTPQSAKNTAFSFFGGDGDDSDIENTEENSMETGLQTPFTKQDMEWRGTRSAAPTPDTAAIGKRFSFSVMDDIDEDDDDEEEGLTLPKSQETVDGFDGLGITNGSHAKEVAKSARQGADGEREESEFAKWFFENRSENNKKWRTRRREAMKLKRKRENRRLTRRIV